MAAHEMVVGYTTDDDGIHLWCTCGAEVAVGFGPTPARVMSASVEHVWAEVHGKVL